MRILVAEDDRVTATLLTSLLHPWGYDVVVAHDGPAAVATFENNPTVQLVLLDWMLPGIDGPEVCRRIHRVRGDRPTYVVLLTSRGAPADVVTGLDAGADDYLVKPFDFNELRARLHAGTRILDLQERLGSKIRELQKVLADVRTLTGLLPICAYCKSIRDDSNYWRQVEEYVGAHSDVQFTHGICPACFPRVLANVDTIVPGAKAGAPG